MNKFLIFLKKHWISIPLCLVILYLCLMNTEPLPKVGMTNFDKMVHFSMFLTVSLVVFFENTYYFKRRISVGKMLYFSFFFPTIYSGLIEIMQEHLSPTRSGDWMDFLFDGLGAFLGFIVCLAINRKIKV